MLSVEGLFKNTSRGSSNGFAPRPAAKPPTDADKPRPPKTHPFNNMVAADDESPPNNQVGPN